MFSKNCLKNLFGIINIKGICFGAEDKYFIYSY